MREHKNKMRNPLYEGIGIKPDECFQQFKRGEHVLLAIRHNGNVAIMDQKGHNYGAYQSIKNFDEFTARNGGIVACRLGCCRPVFHT